MAADASYSDSNSSDTYLLELFAEKEGLDPSMKHASYLLAQEIDRVQNGSKKMIDLHLNKPMKLEAKVRLPAKEYPMINFPGKLLGPKGVTLKQLQEETGTRMMIQGAGSMRDKAKEEEMKKEGGKYVHLHNELNVHLESFGAPSDCYYHMSIALRKLSAFFFQEFFVDPSFPAVGPRMPMGAGPLRPPPPVAWRPPIAPPRPLPQPVKNWSHEMHSGMGMVGPVAPLPQPRYNNAANPRHPNASNGVNDYTSDYSLYPYPSFDVQYPRAPDPHFAYSRYVASDNLGGKIVGPRPRKQSGPYARN